MRGLLLAVVLLTGCAAPLAHRIAAAPNHDDPFRGVAEAPDWLGGADAPGVRATMLPVGAGVSLRAVIVEPLDISFGHGGTHWRRPASARPLEPLGTLVLLHGAYGRADAMLGHAVAAADAGLRAIALDLRGHGRSTGDAITFGHREPAEVIAALQDLRRQGLLRPPVLLLGHSLGGAVAILAARRGAPVDLVAASASYARLDEVAGNFTGLAPWWLRWMPLGWRVPGVLEVFRHEGLDLTEDSPLAAVPGLRMPLVLLHGIHDEFVPVAQAHALAAAAHPTVPVLLDLNGADEGHVTEGWNASHHLGALWRMAAEHLALPLRGLRDDTTGLGIPIGPTPGAERMPPPSAAARAWAMAGTPPLAPSLREERRETGHLRTITRTTAATWLRPPGERLILLWPEVPATWTGRDLLLVLGRVADGYDLWWDGVPLDHVEERGPLLGEARRVRIPGWLATPGHHRLVIRIWGRDGDNGLGWSAGGGILRPDPGVSAAR